MARYRNGDTIRDGNGNIIVGATVSVYLAGTSTAATVYSTVTSVTPANSVTSGSDGRYEFFIDSGDYASSQQFKLIITKPHYVTFTIDNVPVSLITVSIGQISGAFRTVTATSGLLATDSIVEVSPSVADIVLTLPASSDLLPGHRLTFYIPEDNTSGYGCSLIAQGADSVDTFASSLTTAGEYVTIAIYGTKFRRIG